MNTFLEHYTPENCTKASSEIIEKYSQKVPASLIDLWKEHGFGKYNKGLIELINPEDFNDSLWMYLGREVDYYVPIAISAFGDLFYYRMLTDREDMVEGEEIDEDVCVIEVHYRVINTCVWSLNEFFNDYLCDAEVISDLLRKDLFDQANKKLGALDQEDIYYFAPAICIGGTESVAFIEKGNCQTQLEILFELGKEV